MFRSPTSHFALALLSIGLSATPALAGKAPGKKAGKESADKPTASSDAPHARKDRGQQRASSTAGPQPVTVAGKASGRTKRGKPGSHPPAAHGSGKKAPTQTAGGRRPGATPAPRLGSSPPKQSGPMRGAAPKPHADPDRGPRLQDRSKPNVLGAGRPRSSATTPQGGTRSDSARGGRTVRVETSSLLPNGWNPKPHRYHLKDGAQWSAENLTAGIFSYNPPPKRHAVKYVEKNPFTGTCSKATAPMRAVNRAGSFALGMKGGTLADVEQDPAQFSGDMGYGLVARYRPLEALGIEGSWMRHASTGTDPTVRSPLSVSAQLFAFPWTRLSPFVSAGATFGGGSSDSTTDAPGARPHAGLGLELAIGKSIAFDVEARYLSQMQSLADDPVAGGAAQLTGGLLVHF